MDNSFTANAAIITAWAAIVAPAITALIHSVKEYKIAKLNHTIDVRLKLCQAFSKSYSKCKYGSDKIGYMNTFYIDTLQLAAICHKRSVRRNLFLLANAVKEHGATKTTDKLYELCIKLLAKEF